MKTLAYEIVDVFTDRPFTGNPLAVVFGADRLASDQMQALAREFHLSETVFVLPPTLAGASYRVRIFTPEVELPFAGHPSVGAAVTQMRRGLIPPGLALQECGAGLLSLDITAEGRATLTGGPPSIGAELDPNPLLSLLGLTEDDYAGPAPRRAGCGLEFTFLSVRPHAVVHASVTHSIGRRDSVDDLCVFSWDPYQLQSHARVFAPGSGVAEDPATGSAALGFGVWLVTSGLLRGEGASAYTVRQGLELGRPSTMECEVVAMSGLANRVSVAGSVVAIASGTIAIPPFVG